MQKAIAGTGTRNDSPGEWPDRLRSIVLYEIIDLPEIAIIGNEGLCTKEKNAVQDLWQQTGSNFSDIADPGIKNAVGSYVGFWGAMSDETMSFLSWTDDFSRGLYLAGLEVYEDTAVPDGWVKWVMPARKYLVTEVQPETNERISEYVIRSLIPEPGMKMAGAVCDLLNRQPGRISCSFRWSEKFKRTAVPVRSRKEMKQISSLSEAVELTMIPAESVMTRIVS